jgi:DNA mismatch repair protein MutS2
MAETLIEELIKKRAFGIVTTHYSNIKILADKYQELENAAMLFNTETLQPLYKLETGQPGSSFTFEVAENAGIPEQVIDKARKKISKEKLKQILK